MGAVDDFLEDQSKRLHNSYSAERPAEPDAGPLEPPPTPEEMAAAEKYVLKRVLSPATITLIMLEDDPHVQTFACSQGHFLGSVTLLQHVVMLLVDGQAQCAVCGERREIPKYVPVGDEPEYILTALKEHTNGEAPEAK